MKRFLSLLLILVLVLNCNILAFADSEIEVSAKSAVVICADSHEVVYSKNMNERLPMASTTKIMSAIIALEFGADDALQVVTNDMLAVEGSSIGLVDGDKISLKTLVKGMLLESGNDSANATAYIVGGSIPNFVSLMNIKAKEIGMKSTSFETPSGLDGKNHYSTACDMAILGAYAINNPEFKSICNSKSEAVYYGNPPYRRIFTNHNRLLEMYDGAFGIKTGFTKKSGRCLVSAACKDGKTLVAVTLNAPDDWNDHIKMYDYSFDKVNSYNLNTDSNNLYLKIVGGNKKNIKIKTLSTKKYTTTVDNPQIIEKVYIKQFEYAPVFEGDIVGKVEFYCNGVKIAETPLIAAETVEIVKKK